MNLVPTASTTAALALGDALAMTLLVAKGFRQEDFANLHPGGKLGKRLMRVEQLMHGGDQAPIVQRRHADARRDLRDVAQGARHDVRRRRAGRLVGIITDGDLRRHMTRRHEPARPHGRRRDDAQSGDDRARARWPPKRCTSSSSARSPSIVVVDADQRVQGVVHLHDLWRTEMV